MEILFPILAGLIVAAVIVFLVVAVRSFLNPNTKRRSKVERDTFIGSDVTGSGLSEYDSSEYGDSASPEGDTPHAFDGGGEFEGGGSGGSFGGSFEDAGGGSADDSVGGGSDGDFGGDGGNGGGDGGGGNGGE